MDQPSVDSGNRDGVVRRLVLLPFRQPRQIVGFWTSRFRERSEAPIRFLAMGLLLSAAALKYLYLTTTPLLADDSEWQRWFWIIQIELEVFWGIWLLAGIFSHFTHLASALLFLIFAAFSAYNGMMGHVTCGCFGIVKVKPWLAFALDVFFVGGFLFIRATVVLASRKARFSSRRLTAVLVAWALLGVPMFIFSSGPRLATVSEDGEIGGNDQVVLLDPRQWINKRFPLVKHIDIGPTFARDRWRLLFVRPGCPYCEEAVRQLFSEPPAKAKAEDVHWALVELPLLAENASSLALPAQSDLLLGRLDKGKTWLANVPFTVIIADGVVVEWAPGVLQRK